MLLFSFQMVSRISFLLVCVFLGCAVVAWQDEASEQVNSLQEILDRHFEQDIPVSLLFNFIFILFKLGLCQTSNVLRNKIKRHFASQSKVATSHLHLRLPHCFSFLKSLPCLIQTRYTFLKHIAMQKIHG